MRNPVHTAPKASLSDPFRHVDFTDSLGYSAGVKELALHAERLELCLAKFGAVSITDKTLEFMQDPEIALAVRQSIQGLARMQLSERNLPLLLRAALLEASMCERLAEHLVSQDTFDIAPTRFEVQILQKQMHSELIDHLQGIVSRAESHTKVHPIAELIETIRQSSITSFPLRFYREIFSVRSHSDSQIDATIKNLAILTQGTLSIPASQHLKAEHLGGREAIDGMMHNSLLALSRNVEPYEAAYSNDRVRLLYKDLPTTTAHEIRTATGPWFSGLAPEEKRYFLGRIIDNVSDAALVKQCKVLFSAGLSPDAALLVQMDGFISGRIQSGIAVGNNGEPVLDLNLKLPLETIASGCQSVLDTIAHRTSRALSLFDTTQVASEERRRASNTSLFSLLTTDNEFDDPEYRAPIQARTLWEYLEIESDGIQQEALFSAFTRRFVTWFDGSSGEESFVKFQLRLTRDGHLYGRFNDTLYGDGPDAEFDLFEALQPKRTPFPPDYTGPTKLNEFTDDNDPFGVRAESNACYMRSVVFHPNVETLLKALRSEVESFDRLLTELRAVTSETSLRLEVAIYNAPREAARHELLKTTERLALLGGYITPDVTPWLTTLGLPTDEASFDTLSAVEVGLAFRKQLIARDAFPDHHTGNSEKMRSAAVSQQELVEAKDELLNCLARGVTGGVSKFVGRPLELMQWLPEELSAE